MERFLAMFQRRWNWLSFLFTWLWDRRLRFWDYVLRRGNNLGTEFLERVEGMKSNGRYEKYYKEDSSHPC
jgi:hypothetical protein